MKLQQLRYILEVSRQNLNVSDAAETLFTSQPGISKQIRLLEEELGVQIFIRSGKRIVSVSQPGKTVLEIAERILHDVQNIKSIGSDFADKDSGTLAIATTHTQARYALPHVVAQFMQLYPKVKHTIKQGNPSQIIQMTASGEVDFAISTETTHNISEFRFLPCGEWHHAVVVPENHPLTHLDRPLTLADIAAQPLITYDFAFEQGSHIAQTFKQAGFHDMQIALSATDTDVIKTYVKLGIGVGLLAEMAYDSQNDVGLTLLDAHHLFDTSATKIVLRSDTYLRGYAYDFISLFHPALTRERINHLLYTPIEEDFSI